MIPEKVIWIRDVNSSLGGSQDVILWVRGREETASVHRPQEARGDSTSPSTPIKIDTPGTKGSKYRLTVKVLPGIAAARRDRADDILLKTDVPMAGEIRLPVSVLVQSSN